MKLTKASTQCRLYVYANRSDLVTPVTITVAVYKTLSEVLSVKLSITEARTVVGVRVTIVFLISVLKTVTPVPILTTFLDAFVVACIQSGLAKLKRATIAITIIVVTPIAL
jgi:hypothetical protein